MKMARSGSFTQKVFANSSPGRGPRAGSPRGVGALFQPFGSNKNQNDLTPKVLANVALTSPELFQSLSAY